MIVGGLNNPKMNYLREIEEFDAITIKRQVIGDRENPLEHMKDVEFYSKLRFGKDCAHFIYQRIEAGGVEEVQSLPF